MSPAHLNRGDFNESTILLAMTELHSCYQCLSTGQGASLPEQSRRFASLNVALETTGVEPFGVKPKLHLFQELADMDGCQPALSWTYRDEDFGGAGASEVRSPHNRGNWFAGVAEVRRAASTSSLDVSGMRERIMWLRCFIPLVTCVDSVTRLFGRVSQETRVPSTHMNTLPAQAHTWST